MTAEIPAPPSIFIITSARRAASSPPTGSSITDTEGLFTFFPASSMTITARSIPAAKPVPDMLCPPSSFPRSSYRPPPHKAFWAPRLSDKTSYTVLV